MRPEPPEIDMPAPDESSGPTADRILVGLCTYNEAENIGPILARLRDVMPLAEILVVDDNSPDGTPDLVRAWARDDPMVHVIVRENERGLGGAIRRAIRFAIDHEYDFFLNLDADLSHDPAELPELLRVAQGPPPRDVVVGSRYVEGGSIVGWPLRRRVMSRMLNRFASLFLRLPVNDCSGSMRCYRVEALRGLNPKSLRSRGYALLEELLVRLQRQNASFAEVPITFADRSRGESKLTMIEAIRSAIQILRLAIS